MTSLTIKDFDTAMNLGATNKAGVSKLVQAWEAKGNERAKRVAGFGLMAISLAACGGSEDDAVDNAAAVSDALKAAATSAGVVNASTMTDAELVVALIESNDSDAVSAALRDAAADLGVTGTDSMTDEELITAILTVNDVTTIDDAVEALGIDGIDTLAELFAAYDALVNPVAQTFDLTVNVDTLADFTGTDEDDTFMVQANGTTTETLHDLDQIDGAGGDGDVLNINDLGAFTTAGWIGVSISNIEIVNIRSVGSTTLDTTAWTGVDEVNSTLSTAATVTAAATTNVNVSNTGVATVQGGLDVTISSASSAVVGTTTRTSGDVDVSVTGAITVGANSAALNALGDVDASTIGGVVSIMGGTDVTVSSTGAINSALGIIGVGGANALPTGAVDITASASLLDGAAATTASTGAVTVVGGSSVNIDLVGTVSGGSDDATDALTFGAVGVTGSALTTSVAVTQSAAVARAANTVGNLDGTAAIVNAAVTVTDAVAAAGVADTITSVTIANAGAIGITSSALSSLTLSGVTGATTIGGQSTVEATTLAVNLNAGVFGAITATAGTTGYTTANVVATGANVVSGLSVAEATAVNISGTGSATLGTVTTAAAGVITSTNTGGVSLSTMAVGQQFVGTSSSGNDTLTLFAGSTAAHSTGAGDDTVSLTTLVGSVDAGDGTADVLSLTAANAVTLTADATFEGQISNFEQLSIGAVGAATAINLANLDDINYVTSAGSGAFALAISGLQSGGTFAQTALLAGATTLTGALTGGADSFTLRASGADGYANTGALSLAQVETLTIVLDDNSGAVATAAFDLNLDAVNTSTVTVSGDAGITFANSALTLVSVMDASGVTATGAGGAVTFTGNNITSTITGGAGDDALTGGTQDDVISGGIGADALTGGAGNDAINGGDGADVITGGAGVDTLTGGEGADTFVIAADAVDVITDFVAADDGIDAGVVVATYEAITDDGTIAAAADLAAATVAAFVLAGAANDAGIEAIGFEYAGEAYVAVEAGALTNATGAILAQLDDLTGLAAANF